MPRRAGPRTRQGVSSPTFWVSKGSKRMGCTGRTFWRQLSVEGGAASLPHPSLRSHHGDPPFRAMVPEEAGSRSIQDAPEGPRKVHRGWRVASGLLAALALLSLYARLRR